MKEKGQRSIGARCPSAALSDVRLWGIASGLLIQPYVVCLVTPQGRAR